MEIFQACVTVGSVNRMRPTPWAIVEGWNRCVVWVKAHADRFAFRPVNASNEK